MPVRLAPWARENEWHASPRSFSHKHKASQSESKNESDRDREIERERERSEHRGRKPPERAFRTKKKRKQTLLRKLERAETVDVESAPHGRWGQCPGSVDPRFPAGLPFPAPEILEFVAPRDLRNSFQELSRDFPGVFLGNPQTDPGNSHSLLEFLIYAIICSGSYVLKITKTNFMQKYSQGFFHKIKN